jgi:hypothetical protein
VARAIPASMQVFVPPIVWYGSTGTWLEETLAAVRRLRAELPGDQWQALVQETAGSESDRLMTAL